MSEIGITLYANHFEAPSMLTALEVKDMHLDLNDLSEIWIKY